MRVYVSVCTVLLLFVSLKGAHRTGGVDEHDNIVDDNLVSNE